MELERLLEPSPIECEAFSSSVSVDPLPIDWSESAASTEQQEPNATLKVSFAEIHNSSGSAFLRRSTSAPMDRAVIEFENGDIML